MTLKELSALDLERQHAAHPNYPKEYLVATKFSGLQGTKVELTTKVK